MRWRGGSIRSLRIPQKESDPIFVASDPLNREKNNKRRSDQPRWRLPPATVANPGPTPFRKRPRECPNLPYGNNGPPHPNRLISKVSDINFEGKTATRQKGPCALGAIRAIFPRHAPDQVLQRGFSCLINKTENARPRRAPCHTILQIMLATLKDFRG